MPVKQSKLNLSFWRNVAEHYSQICHIPSLRACLGGEGSGKDEGASGRNRGLWEERALGFFFSS